MDKLKRFLAIFAVSLLSGTCWALEVPFVGDVQNIGETAYKGVQDSIYALMSGCIDEMLALVKNLMTYSPNVKGYPSAVYVNRSFTWLSGFFVIILSAQGIGYIMSAESPHTRFRTKQNIQKLVIGMVIVALNGIIFDTGLNLSDQLTNAFVGRVSDYESGGDPTSFTKLIGSGEIALTLCLVFPIAGIVLAAVMLIYFCRYVALIIVFSLFPLILAFYVSQIGFLSRIGSKGLSVFVACLLCGPVMGLLIRIGLSFLIGDIMEGGVKDMMFSIFMGLAAMLLAALSPIGLFGFSQQLGGIASSVFSSVGGAAGAAVGGGAGAAFGGAVGSSAGGLMGAAAGFSKPSSGSPFGFSQMEGENIKKAGEAADEKLDEKTISKDVGYYDVPYGNIGGNVICRGQAEKSGALVDNRIELRDALERKMNFQGERYNVAVAENPLRGGYDVVGEELGGSRLMFFNVSSPGASNRDDVFDQIEQMEGNGLNLYKNLKSISR